MIKTYVTFGQVHVHSVNGKTFDKDCIACIEAPTAEAGRDDAFKIFDGVFGTTYWDEQQVKDMLHLFPRGIINVE